MMIMFEYQLITDNYISLHQHILVHLLFHKTGQELTQINQNKPSLKINSVRWISYTYPVL